MSSAPGFLEPSKLRSLRLWWRYALLSMLLVTVILPAPLRSESLTTETAPVPLESANSSSLVGEVLHENDWAIEDGTTCLPPNTSRGNIRLSADALFWTVREGSADNWAQVITPKEALGSYVGTATLVDAPFDWNTGFRVGLECQRGTDGSGIALQYTNFNTTATSRAAGEVYSAFLGNFFADNTDGDAFGPHYRSASIQWDFEFQTIDLQVQRSLPIARNLTVRPFIGLKTAFINQSVKSCWHQPIDTAEKTYHFTSANEDLKQNFWGIGPSLGATLKIPLYTRQRYTLKFFGTPSGALMYGHWTFSDVYTNDGPTSISIDSNPITGVATMVSCVMGIEWTQRFSRASTTLRVGYESQIWLNQMQFYSYNMGRLNNLMSLHGGILEFSINY